MPQYEKKNIFMHKQSKRHQISLMTMETTTNLGKYQKFSRKVREESVEPH